MKIIRKNNDILAVSIAAILAASAAGAAECPDGFPAKPVNFVVGFNAGGGTDVAARLLASEIEKSKGWTVVVENKPGAGGNVMMTALKAAEPDGYTIGIASTNAVTLDPYANEGVQYTYEDFDYLGTGLEWLQGLVALSDAPYNNLEEFAAYAKQKGRVTISVAAIVQEIAMGQIGEYYGAEFVGVPTEGASASLQAALGGHVDATVQSSQHIAQIEAGKMKQIVTLSSGRAPYAPDTMTLSENGVPVSLVSHLMIAAPKGIDPAVRECLVQTLDEAIFSDAFKDLAVNFNTVASNLGLDGSLAFISERAAEYQKMFEKKS